MLPQGCRFAQERGEEDERFSIRLLDCSTHDAPCRLAVSPEQVAGNLLGADEGGEIRVGQGDEGHDRRIGHE
jgi:hypothetical protein